MIKILMTVFGLFICIRGQYHSCPSNFTRLSPNCNVEHMISIEECQVDEISTGERIYIMVSSYSQSVIGIIGLHADGTKKMIYWSPINDGKWLQLEVDLGDSTIVTVSDETFINNDTFVKIKLIVQGHLYIVKGSLFRVCQNELLGYVLWNKTNVSTVQEEHAAFGKMTSVWKPLVVCIVVLLLIITSTLALHNVKMRKNFKEAQIDAQTSKSEMMRLRNQLMKKIPRVPSAGKDIQYYDLDEKPPEKSAIIAIGHEGPEEGENEEGAEYDGFEE